MKLVLSNTLTQSQPKMAQTNLILDNLKLAKFFVRKYPQWTRKGNVRSDDKLQAARLGLCMAAERYDENKSKISTYAKFWIRHCMQRWCHDSAPVRVPNHIATKMGGVLQNAARIKVRKGTDKSLRYLHWAIERYALWPAWSIISYQTIDTEDVSNRDPYDSINFDKMNLLTDREALVIRFRFGINVEPRTLEYIAENILGNISRERVRQIEADALKKLR